MDKISYSIENEVAQIILDDGKVNAMNWDFFQEIGKCLDKAEDDRAKVLVITGRLVGLGAGATHLRVEQARNREGIVADELGFEAAV